MTSTRKIEIMGRMLAAEYLFVFIFSGWNALNDADTISWREFPEEHGYFTDNETECRVPEIPEEKPAPKPKIPAEIIADAIFHETEFIPLQGLLREASSDDEHAFLEKIISDEQQSIYRHYNKSLTSLDYLYKRLPLYSEIIVEAAEREAVPILIAIGIVLQESSCNPRAVHPKTGAAGLMQLDADTARKFGLKVTRQNDERFDPQKSIDAGMRIMRYLHDRYGRWDLALLGYAKGTGAFDAQLFRNFQIRAIDPEQIAKAKITFAMMKSQKITGLTYPARIEAMARLWLWYEKVRQPQPLLVVQNAD